MIAHCPNCNHRPVTLISTDRNPRYRRAGEYVHRFRVTHFACPECGSHFEHETFVNATKLEGISHDADVEVGGR